MKRVLIIGALGQLGKSFNCIQDDYTGFKFFLRNKTQLDITSIKELNKEINKNKINIIVNCAAYTDVLKAEKNNAIAMEVNSDGVKNIVELIQGTSCKLIHISTDYVFDGSKTTKYLEDDNVNPINNYGKSKALGEKHILKSNTNSIIIRTSWLFSEFNNNFVKKIITLSKTKNEIKVINNQYGTPTYANDLAHFCIKICNEYEDWNQSILHFTNWGSTNRYLLAKQVVDQVKLNCKIIPINNSDEAELLRPKNSVLSIEKIDNELNYIPRRWELALEDCLNKMQLKNK
jgi:dTDP-4-dehydrorhamnose reductase